MLALFTALVAALVAALVTAPVAGPAAEGGAAPHALPSYSVVAVLLHVDCQQFCFTSIVNMSKTKAPAEGSLQALIVEQVNCQPRLGHLLADEHGRLRSGQEL